MLKFKQHEVTLIASFKMHLYIIVYTVQPNTKYSYNRFCDLFIISNLLKNYKFSIKEQISKLTFHSIVSIKLLALY